MKDRKTYINLSLYNKTYERFFNDKRKGKSEEFMGNYLYLDDPRTEQMRQAIEFNERNKNTAKLWVRLQQWTKDWNDRSKVEISYNEPNKPKQYVKKMAINNAELLLRMQQGYVYLVNPSVVRF